MNIKNNITETNPCVLHAYGSSHTGEEWIELIKLTNRVEASMPNDVTIISFFHGDKSFALKNQLEDQFIPYINASTSDITIWQDREKIRLIHNAIKKVKTTYVLVLDGIDVLLADNIIQLIDKFKETDCKLLYNACTISHPLSYNINEIKGDESLGKFNLLNTGAFIGESEFVNTFYDDVMTIYDDINMPVPESDGIRIGLKCKKYPEIKIDSQCDVFQTLLGVEYTIENNNLTITE